MKTSVHNLIPHFSRSSSFRLYLQADLARRCSSNPQYSLRSYALHLGMNHSTLSQLLRGKRQLTPRTIEKLGTRLGLNRTEIEAFISHELQETGTPSAVSNQIRQLTVDTASLLSDPVHRDILELLRLENFIPDSRWIARVLKLSIDEVNIAITRLTRLGLMEMTGQTRWTDLSGTAGASDDAFAHLIVQRLFEQVRRLPGISPGELF